MKKVPELVAAAQTIEDDQKRLEELAHALHKTKLQNEKHIARAQRELTEALEQQDALATSLRALGAAMANMQERQQAVVTALAARAHEIQTRQARLGELMLGYAALGAKAAELLQAIAESLEAADKSAALVSARERIEPIVEEATALAKTAREEEFTDVAHEADVLKQKFQQIRAQLGAAKTTVNGA
ncbi:MAG TPA: hypothetical protein VLM85_17235 [Polyangiaceae bacterium]|nr:hypothetical protein [Polyangiaceae bacterium]